VTIEVREGSRFQVSMTRGCVHTQRTQPA